MKEEYPDGVVLNIIDHTMEIYDIKSYERVNRSSKHTNEQKLDHKVQIIELNTLKEEEDEEVSQIKVKDGNNLFILKIPASNNIESIYKYIEQYMYLII